MAESAAEPRYDEQAHEILTAIDSEAHVSQRSLSQRLGIALGLTNLLIRRLVQKGWVRMVGVKPHRVRYLLTPKGIAEKARMSQVAFQNSVERYRHARDRIQTAFTRLSMEWPEGEGPKEIVFYGTGEVAEIGYICLQGTDLELVGVIDDRNTQPFFGVPICSPRDSIKLLSQHDSARVILMRTGSSEKLAAEIERMGVPGSRIVRI